MQVCTIRWEDISGGGFDGDNGVTQNTPGDVTVILFLKLGVAFGRYHVLKRVQEVDDEGVGLEPVVHPVSSACMSVCVRGGGDYGDVVDVECIGPKIYSREEL